MGRGNVCVSGDYEGLYYIDCDYFKVYMLDGDGNETDEIDYQAQNDYMRIDLFGEFRRLFVKRFPSFYLVDKWLCGGCHRHEHRHAILENGLFFICLVDNEWSVAVELIQKDYNTGDYDDFMPSLQRRHYKNYLEGMKSCLLELYPEIGVYEGAWTSGTIKRSEAIIS